MFKKLRRKFLWKLVYNKVYSVSEDFSIQTLNFGYAHSSSTDGIGPSRSNHADPNVYGYQLYSAVLSFGTLNAGMKVLEVGCGTGCGLTEQAVTNPDVEFKGVDFSRNSIKSAESKFSNIKNLSFIEGNAMDLPFENEAFDLVFNIESSHCYTDKGKFFSEVQRVLKPAGIFLIADFRMPVNYNKFLQLVKKYFQLTKEVDITENVVKSLQKLTPFRTKIFNDYFKNRPYKRILAKNQLERFAGIEGSLTFERFKNGYWKYFICALQKND